jgi:hypothetical protein
MAMRKESGVEHPLTNAKRTRASTRISSPLTARWCKVIGSAFHTFRLGDDLKHVVHARWREEVERHRAHDE